MIENRAPSGAATTYPPRSVASGSKPPSRFTGAIFWRERTSAVGPSRRPSACAQATAVSSPSQGRQTWRFGIARSAVRCSIG